MSDLAIRVENLSKQYRIGEFLRHDSLKDMLTSTVTWPYRKVSNLFARNGAHSSVSSLPSSVSGHPTNSQSAIPNSKSDFFWALKDVSFEVKQGEVVGFIGPNGAGKSTLLKLLTGIMEPTYGRAEIYGRVSSLLEVGTGFDKELTGRENIYFNGSILGMTKHEINMKFDEIVDFSGVEKFIDTPLKRYSSGMYIRLAFAVAAHLEPDILIIDEVLAVGDAAFQKKCLGKMEDVANKGRTVLFVSHNMAAVESLCERCLLLREGSVVQSGNPGEIIVAYLDQSSTPTCDNLDLIRISRESNLSPVFQNVTLTDSDGKPTNLFFAGKPMIILLSISIPKNAIGPRLAIGINDSLGNRLFTVATYYSLHTLKLSAGINTVRCTIPHLSLGVDTYTITLGIISNNGLYDHLDKVVKFSVETSDYFGSGQVPNSASGRFLVKSDWKVLDA